MTSSFLVSADFSLLLLAGGACVHDAWGRVQGLCFDADCSPGHAFLEYMDSNFPDFDFGLVFTISHCLTLHCEATNKILSDIQLFSTTWIQPALRCSGKEMLIIMAMS